MLAVAGKILRDYGKVLGEIEPGCAALPRSFLPHPRGAIQEATLRVLATLSPGDDALRDALIRGFVFLAQFVDDDDAERVAEGQAQMLLKLLRVKGFTISPELAARVESCKDLDQLDLWAERVLTATTLDDIFPAAR